MLGDIRKSTRCGLSPLGVSSLDLHRYGCLISMSENRSLIPLEDAETIARVLGEVAGHSGDVTARKRLLMTRLREVTGADGWLWSMTYHNSDKHQPASVGVIHEGLTPDQFEGWVEASQIADPPPPEDQPLSVTLERGEHYTRTRDQLVTDEAWYHHPTVAKYRLERGIDDFLYSIYPLGGPDMCSAIGLFRHVGREKFPERTRRLVHIILANVEWLHFAGLPEHRDAQVVQLTPTQRIALVHLLAGKSRLAIAQAMGVSENTVRDHIRAVYRFYDVSNQVALICHFRAGNGETNPPTADERTA